MMRSLNASLIIVILLLCIMGAAACSPASSLVILESNLAVNEFTADITESTAAVDGVVVNEGIWPVENCEVVAEFYDYQGNKIASNSYALPKLGSRQTAHFKIELKGNKAWNVARCSVSINKMK
ncbi:MAG: hypothetical protein JXA01_01105 [Dehalococcoidia bacterium]|nr:hypothetical protein [Dehalococcoidia bacterium]